MTTIDLPTIPGATLTLTVQYAPTTLTVLNDAPAPLSLDLPRTCDTCGTEKPLFEFGPSKGDPSGHKPTCRPCVRTINRTYREKRRDTAKLKAA